MPVYGQNTDKEERAALSAGGGPSHSSKAALQADLARGMLLASRNIEIKFWFPTRDTLRCI